MRPQLQEGIGLDNREHDHYDGDHKGCPKADFGFFSWGS